MHLVLYNMYHIALVVPVSTQKEVVKTEALKERQNG